MKFLVNGTRRLEGEVGIPGNKSGTARSIVLGSLAKGVTKVHNPLLNIDSFSIIGMFRAMGTKIDTSQQDLWIIEGTGGDMTPPGEVLDAGNSGTGYYMVNAVASLIVGTSVISGDYQICRRPAQPQIDALNALGATVYSTRTNGAAPLVRVE
jgi:3-phosphoshikimate 1-carboxyvinyltransferase